MTNDASFCNARRTLGTRAEKTLSSLSLEGSTSAPCRRPGDHRRCSSDDGETGPTTARRLSRDHTMVRRVVLYSARTVSVLVSSA